MASRIPRLDYHQKMRELAADMIQKLPEFSHVRLENVAFSITHAKVEGHGQYAKIVPMRFEGGTDIRVYKKRRYRIPPLHLDGKEILYAIYFCMPKFQNLPFDDKLLTVIHELYHISPQFNGDIRRFPGRNYAHGSSRKAYNDRVQQLVDAYLNAEPDPDAIAFLIPDAETLQAQYGRIVAPRIPMPKLVPLDPARKKAA